MSAYLKTAVYAALGDATKMITPWELQFYVTESQRAIASMLPWQVVPEIVDIARGTAPDALEAQKMGVGSIGGSVYAAPGMEVIGVSIDTANYVVGTHANPVAAVEVSPTHFFNKMSDYAYGAIGGYYYCQKNGKIITNVKAGTGWPSDGSAGNSLVISHKSSPRDIPLTGGANTISLRLAVSGSIGSNYLQSTNKMMSDYPNIGDVYSGGGVLCSVGTLDSSSVGGLNHLFKITDIYDFDTGSSLRLRIAMDKTLLFTATDAILIARPGTDSSAWPIDENYLSPKWVLPIVDHALSSLWLKLGDGNRSQAYMKSFIDRLNSMGATAKAK